MAYESVKNQIDAYIKANGVNLITGPVLNAVLTTMLDELGEGYAFQGVLDTTDIPSPAADIPQAWLASAGTYLGGSITVDEGELALIIHTADGWSKETVYRGVQLSHDAIVAALGYTPADEADLAEKQDAIADLSDIRSGAALGSTSVQPADIENMVEAEPIGSIVPPVNPSEFATKEEVNQLGQEIRGFVNDYSIPVVSGNTLIYDIPISIKSGTPISFLFDSTALVSGTVTAYLYTGDDRVGYALTQGVQNEVIPSADIDKIRINRGSTGIIGTGNIFVHIGLPGIFAKQLDLEDLKGKTTGFNLSLLPLNYYGFIVKNGESVVVKNNTNLPLDLYFAQNKSSLSTAAEFLVPALSSATFTASMDYNYLWVQASGDEALVDRSVLIAPTDSIIATLGGFQSAINDNANALGVVSLLLNGKQILLKGQSDSYVTLDTAIVLSQDGDSFEVSAVKTNDNNTGAYAFAGSGLSSSYYYAIQLGATSLGIRNKNGVWLFKDLQTPDTVEKTLKIEYANGKILTTLNGILVDTQNTQTDVVIGSFGNGGDGAYGYWGGRIKYVKVNGVNFDLFQNATMSNITVLDDEAEEDAEGILSYDATNSRFEYFGKNGSKYLSFVIAHEIDNDSTVLKNVWRLVGGYVNTKSGTSFVRGIRTIDSGENEWANSFSDFQAFGGFVGGYHGGELITDDGCFVRFFADGKEITSDMMSVDFSMNCREFKYIQYAGLHKVQTRGSNPVIIDGQPIFAYHAKETTICGGKIHTLNVVKFVDSVTRSTYHSGLFCFAKGVANNVILPVGISALNMVGDNSYIDADYKLIGNGFVWNTTNNISADIDSRFVSGVDNEEMALGTGVLQFWNRTNDTKYYRRTTKTVGIASGEVIVTENTVEFNAV